MRNLLRRGGNAPHDYKNWTYNVGAGANLDSGTTRTWVRQGGFVAAAGVARNANKYFGLRADFIFANLPLRDSTQQLAQATGATSYAYAVTLDPIINIPVTKALRRILPLGPGFFHRSGSLESAHDSSRFVVQWVLELVGRVPEFEFQHSSQRQLCQFQPEPVRIQHRGGRHSQDAERRRNLRRSSVLMHGSHNGITTDYRPITIGVRW